jgi:hypothetical protein
VTANELDRLYLALQRDDVPGPKELIACVAAPATDELVDQLDDAQAVAGGSLQFAIMDDELVAFATVRGNPWDLHDVLREVAVLTERFPIEIQYEPPQEIDAAALAAWVARHPAPAPAGFTGARIRCRVPADRLDAIREAIADRGVELDGEVIRLGATAIPGVVDAVLREVVFADDPWSVEVALDGPSPWTVTVTSFAQRIALGYLLDALAPYAPPVDEPEPQIELPALSGAEQLEHVPRVRINKIRTIGEVTGDPVSIETKLRLGRIRTWLHYRGQRSRAFINTKPIAVDVDRVVLGAERDGTAELLSIALPGFVETKLQTFAKGDHGINRVPSEIAVHDGRVILVWSTPDETRFVRDDSTLARIPGSLERLDRAGDVVYAFTNDLYRISLADGSVRAAGTQSSERVELFVARGRWYAWAFRDGTEIYVAEDARVVRTLSVPAGETSWTFDLSPTGTLAAVSRGEDRYTLHVMYADRTERFALTGEASIRFRSQSGKASP